MKKYFASNLLSHGSNEQNYLLKDAKNSVFELFNKNINLSNEFQYWTAQETIWIYDLLFFIALYFPKNENKHPSEIRN